MRLAGKVAVVLGASAEGGTGWGIAEALAAEGAKVVVAARKLEPLQRLAEKIGGLAVACDAAKPEEIAALAGAAIERFGAIDLAVNSAARPITGLITDTDPVAIQKSLDVNFLGHVHFVREMAAGMTSGGSIVLISTSSAVQPLLPFFPYACAKAATDALVRYAALEYGPRGIRVNSILPGPIKTAAAAHIYATPGTEEAASREIPLGRVGLPEDFARVVLMLAETDYITGVNLPVSGGMHLTRAARSDEMPRADGFIAKRGEA